MNFWDKFEKGFTCLAPMEGVTDIAFRQVVAKATRPDIFFTEFTNVNVDFAAQFWILLVENEFDTFLTFS